MRGPKLRDARAGDLDDPLRFLATAQGDLNEHRDRPVGVTFRNARAYHGVRQALANGPLNGTKAIHADAFTLPHGYELRLKFKPLAEFFVILGCPRTDLVERVHHIIIHFWVEVGLISAIVEPDPETGHWWAGHGADVWLRCHMCVSFNAVR